MCGICGVRRFNDKEPIREEQIRMLLIANMRRGNHATGLALQNPKEDIHVLKMDTPAWSFVCTDAYKAFIHDHLTPETYTFLGHTRLATQGDPKNNDNNHPLYAGVSAVVHNGHISNDDFMFSQLKMKRYGEVDSEAIRAVLDKDGLTKDGIKTLSKLSGSAAIAAISNEQPGKLLLARSGNPIVIATTPGQLCWSSEKDALHVALRPFQNMHGLIVQPRLTADVGWQTMNNDSAYLFGEKGFEWHQEMKVASYYRAPIYAVNKDFVSRRNRWYDLEKTDLVWCSTGGHWVSLDKEQQKVPLYDLICDTCKEPLAVEEETKS